MPAYYRPDYSQPEFAARVGKRKQLQDQAAEDEPQSTRHRKRAKDNRRVEASSYNTDQDVDYGPNADWYHPNYDRKPESNSTAPVSRNVPAATEFQRRNKKSLKERKGNPSTQIKSLRNLLDKDSLPATIRQEKQRELAALLFDQQTNMIKRDAKKNLKRYHFIRFVERQKANRTIKQLKKKQEIGGSSEKLKQQLHEAEVDLNYTMYAPLAQKYVAIYARDDSMDGKARPLPRNLSHMKKADYAMLSDDQRYQIELTSMEEANLLHMDSKSGVKPPMWYVVESKMEEGEEALKALREQQDKVSNIKIDLAVSRGAKKTPDWLTDDGMINPEDLDSDSDADGGVAVTNKNNEDEQMSDGDGGFFEKR